MVHAYAYACSFEDKSLIVLFPSYDFFQIN